MDGECSGKMRSTPTPAEILRTVNVSLIPAPRRPRQTPSKACSRSLSPSRTRTITRTVSPGWNAGRLVFSPSRSIALSRSIASSLCVQIFHPQIGPPLPRQSLGLRLAPGGDLRVVAAQQYRRHIQSAIARGSRVARRGEQPVVVRVRGRRLVVPERAPPPTAPHRPAPPPPPPRAPLIRH